MVGRPSRRSGFGRVAISEGKDFLLEVREWSEGPLVVPGVVERPSWRSGSGWGGPFGGLGRHSGGPGVVGRPSRRYGSGREALPEVWELWEGPPCGSGVVWRSSRRSGSGRETLPVVRSSQDALSENPMPSRKFGCGSKSEKEVREWTVGPLGGLGLPPGGPGVVERHSHRVRTHFRTSRSGREALLEVREWSGGPPGGPGVIGRPSQRVGMPFGGSRLVRRSS